MHPQSQGETDAVQERRFCKLLFVKWLWWPPLESFNRDNWDGSHEVTAKKAVPGFYHFRLWHRNKSESTQWLLEVLTGRQIKQFKYKFGCLAYPEAPASRATGSDRRWCLCKTLVTWDFPKQIYPDQTSRKVYPPLSVMCWEQFLLRALAWHQTLSSGPALLCSPDPVLLPCPAMHTPCWTSQATD